MIVNPMNEYDCEYDTFWNGLSVKYRVYSKVLEFGEYSIIIQDDLSPVRTFYFIDGQEAKLKTLCSPDASIIFFDTKEYKKYFKFHTINEHDTYVEMFVKGWGFKFV